MTYSPTAKQLALLRFIHGFQEARNRAPSFEEMRRATGRASKSGVFRLVRDLIERGQVRRGQIWDVFILADPPPIPRCPRGQPLYFVPIKQGEP